MRNVDIITVARDLEREATSIATAAHSCARKLVLVADRLPPEEVEAQKAISELCKLLGDVALRIGPSR